MPHRGKIVQINLHQITGNDAGTFEIYDSEPAARVYDSSSSSSSALEGGDPAVNSVTNGPVAITNGKYQSAVNLPYINRDGTPTNPVRRLWMRINSGGSGMETYGLSMMIEPAALDG